MSSEVAKWNDIFNPPTFQVEDVDDQNQFTFVESSDNEVLKPEDFVFQKKK